MEVKAYCKHIRMSPRKLRLVADSIRGLSLSEAVVVLDNLGKIATGPFLEILKQGKGNAVNNFSLIEESLIVKAIEVGEGPTLKRWRAVSRGRARTINKRTGHISVTLEGKERQKVEVKKGKKVEKKVKNKKVRPETEKEHKYGSKS